MSKTAVSKASAVLVSFSLLVTATFPVIAQDSTSAASTSRLPVVQAKKPLIQQKINIRQEKVEDKIESLREKMASRAAILKTRLEAFKDQKKAVAAERINTNLNRINQNQAEQMQKHLTTMSTILDKLETRVNQQTADIKDPANAKIAIAAAKATIASTSASVQTQSQKDYTIQVTSEARIKADAKAQRDSLHTDLLSMRKMVVDAKQAVANAIRVAKAGPSSASNSALIEKEGTSSGQE